jgi:hypothetical protein
MGTGALSLALKRWGREADHSPPASAEIKECVELYLHYPVCLMAWSLVKRRDNFTLPLTFIITIIIIIIIIIIFVENVTYKHFYLAPWIGTQKI